ncbi:MAG: hypothetical protein ACTS8Z_05710 [Candidatus Limnocylindrales bacterium]
MIRNAVLHINNEQPLVADLFELPEAGDQGLRCTNLRQLDGKRPIFADDMASVFFFPYLHIRFVEIPAAAAVGSGLDLPMPVATAVTRHNGNGTPEPEEDLEIDEDFLRRIREV